MTDAEMIRAIYEALPTLLENQRRVLEALEGQARPAPRRPEDSIISLGEAAEMLRLRPETLQRRKAGTHAIPRHSDRPVTFRLGEVEKFIRNGGVKREAAATPKRLSLVRRRKSAA